MDFATIFFSIMSLVTIIYLSYIFKRQKRLPILLELFYIGIYGFIFLVFLYPNTLNIIQNIFGISSAINFIIYLSIFVAYFLIFTLYNGKEKHRQEITKLTREIAYLKENKKR